MISRFITEARALTEVILIRTITSLRTSFPVIQSIVGALLLITMTAANKRIFRYPVLLPMRNSMAAIIGR